MPLDSQYFSDIQTMVNIIKSQVFDSHSALEASATFLYLSRYAHTLGRPQEAAFFIDAHLSMSEQVRAHLPRAQAHLTKTIR